MFVERCLWLVDVGDLCRFYVTSSCRFKCLAFGRFWPSSSSSPQAAGRWVTGFSTRGEPTGWRIRLYAIRPLVQDGSNASDGCDLFLVLLSICSQTTSVWPWDFVWSGPKIVVDPILRALNFRFALQFALTGFTTLIVHRSDFLLTIFNNSLFYCRYSGVCSSIIFFVIGLLYLWQIKLFLRAISMMTLVHLDSLYEQLFRCVVFES